SAKRVGPMLTAVAAAAGHHPQLSIREAGAASIKKATDDKLGKDYNRAERLSVPIALFVLLFAFGALVAALLPVALALTAVFGATGYWPSPATTTRWTSRPARCCCWWAWPSGWTTRCS